MKARLKKCVEELEKKVAELENRILGQQLVISSGVYVGMKEEAKAINRSVTEILEREGHLGK